MDLDEIHRQIREQISFPVTDEVFLGNSQPQPESQGNPTQPPSLPRQVIPPTTTENGRGFRMAKSTAKKIGNYVPRGKGRGRKGTGRSFQRTKKASQTLVDDEEPWDSDLSDDEDFDITADDGESDSDDEFCADFSEEDDILADEIQKMQFEDYLDGSSGLDQIYKNGTIVGDEPFGSIKIEPWMIFSDREHLLGVFRDFCIQEGFAVRVEKADNKRFTATCIIEACDWRIHASRLNDNISWAVKTLSGEHKTCGRLEDNPMVSSSWLCKHLLEDMQANPEIPVVALQKLCMERFRINVKKRLFYKVKSMAKEKTHGGFNEAYGMLPAYAEMIKQTNPGSYALITWTANSADVTPHFKACFFSFAAQVKGFLRGCRPIIGIDGAFLSGYFKGILLTAVGIDGNNEIFVIAYGIVSSESIDSWSYFFRNLKCLFEKEGCHRNDWTFISDRMRGVESAVYEVFPTATRRICCQHLYSNCKTAGWSGTAFHKLFWIAADAYNNYVFKKAMEKIRDLDPAAVQYLNSTEEQWSRHVFDPTVCCDHNTTNFVESFNACTKPYRDLPVLTLLEAIRNWCMKRIGIRFDKAVDIGPNDLTEYATKILEIRGADSRFCHVTVCGGGEFEVRDGNVYFPIRLENRSCGCGKWQGSGIPCKHALRVIFNQRLEPADFVTPYFKGAAYRQTYGEHIHPMPDSTQWPAFPLPVIEPPPLKRGAGRPAKQRKRGPNEAKKGKRSSSVKCSKCKELGHNSRTCQGGSTAKQRKQASVAATASSQQDTTTICSSQQPQQKVKKRKNAGVSSSKATTKGKKKRQ